MSEFVLRVAEFVRPLPQQFQPELHLARRGGRAGDCAGRAGSAGGIRGGGRREGDQVGRIEIGAVQQVEKFRAELQG